MAGIEIDKKLFHERLSSFLTQWKADKRSGDGVFGGAGSICIVVGKGDELTAEADTKTAAFQLWLLSYEFPQTLIILTPDVVHFVTTKKKAVYLENLQGGKVPIEVHKRGKEVEENNAQFTKLAELIKSSGNKVGTIPNEPQNGAFADEWKEIWTPFAKDVQEVDITAGISTAALSIKDENELRAVRDASRASSRVLGKFFVDEMSTIVDEEKKVTHEKLANKIRDLIDKDNGKWFIKNMGKDFDIGSLDWSMGPFIQSGGVFDIKFNTPSDDKNLYDGVIVAALGCRYNSYNSFVARSYIVNPTKAQEQNYKLLFAIHTSLLRNLKDGAVASEVYEKAVAQVKAKDPEMVKNFAKYLGYGVGLQVNDKSLTISAKCQRTLKDGMTLVVSTAFSDLDNPKASTSRGKKYSLVLADTVRVTVGEAVVFTSGKDAPADWENVNFILEEPEQATPKKSKRDSKIGAVAQSNIRSQRLRHERQGNLDAEKEAARRSHQHELHHRLNRAGVEKFAKSTNGLNGKEEKKFKRFESYKREDDLPSNVKDMGIHLDLKRATLILPILGRAVPFHINTIKNASNTPEGEYTSLRINFLSPGQGVGKKDDLPFEDPQAQFVRSLTFRSKETSRMAKLATDVTELKKESIRREQEKKQLEDVIEQDKLVLERRPKAILDMIQLRPALDTKRIPGTVEIHANGIRYRHGVGAEGTKVDVLFNNVKHFFFQPCKHEMMVIIHFHLINPIMIGKKKTKDVQFCRDATDVAFDETGNRKRKHRHGDEDEFEQEQEERKRRAELDKLFLKFAKQVEEAGVDENIKLDMPLRDMSWHGVPSRSNVVISPTSDCLVQLTEQPFLVVTLDEIELVHLERVSFGLKNFDMVIIFKDYTRPVQHINTIPMESIDLVKDWLDSVDIPYHEGVLNLQWGSIMKTLLDDPHEFFKEGGWNFLSQDSDDEGEDEESEESAFEMSGDDFGSEESSEAASDFDENASQEAEDEEMSEVSDGEDWDELERKAAKTDRHHESEDEKVKKKKR